MSVDIVARCHGHGDEAIAEMVAVASIAMLENTPWIGQRLVRAIDIFQIVIGLTEIVKPGCR